MDLYAPALLLPYKNCRCLLDRKLVYPRTGADALEKLLLLRLLLLLILPIELEHVSVPVRAY
jgi:hypothetical protein